MKETPNGMKNENEKRSIVKNDEHSRTRRESTSYLETNTRQYDSQARIDTSCRRKETKNKSKTTQDLSIFCDKDIRRNEEEMYQGSQHTGIKNQLFSHEKEKSKSEINWNKTVTKKENFNYNVKTVTSEDEPLRNRDPSPESIASIECLNEELYGSLQEAFSESDEEIGKLMPSLNLDSFITTISDNKKALNLRKENFIHTIHPNSKEQSKTRSYSTAIQQDITQENLFDRNNGKSKKELKPESTLLVKSTSRMENNEINDILQPVKNNKTSASPNIKPILTPHESGKDKGFIFPSSDDKTQTCSKEENIGDFRFKNKNKKQISWEIYK
ncbi:hypothetical protein LUQ84_001967 [Hamiltosporidium tvaerminnensis]|nr:hypothetical protein LUQ84_001967 [Hamiltosporidium tvaerminnensis]